MANSEDQSFPFLFPVQTANFGCSHLNVQTLDPLYNIKGLSLKNVSDLGCSNIMEVKHKLSETCDLSAKKLLKSNPII